MNKASISLEEIKARFATFFTETFTAWYGKEIAAKVEQKPSLTKPEDIEWKALENDVDRAKFGEYSLNPKTQCLNFETVPPEKIKVLDLEEMIGRSLAEVGECIVAKYGATHHILGVEYWQYVIQNHHKAPSSLKGGATNHLFGSTLRSRVGRIEVPSAAWDGRQFERGADWFDEDWTSFDRVVLLEK